MAVEVILSPAPLGVGRPFPGVRAQTGIRAQTERTELGLASPTRSRGSG